MCVHDVVKGANRRESYIIGFSIHTNEKDFILGVTHFECNTALHVKQKSIDVLTFMELSSRLYFWNSFSDTVIVEDKAKRFNLRGYIEYVWHRSFHMIRKGTFISPVLRSTTRKFFRYLARYLIF